MSGRGSRQCSPIGRLDDLAIWQWVPDPGQDARAEDRGAGKVDHWMLTPFREVTFTHAVQQPLVVPDTSEGRSRRASLGDTFAAFRGPIANHAKSTGRLDVFGDVDGGRRPGHRRRAAHARVWNRGGTPGAVAFGLRQPALGRSGGGRVAPGAPRIRRHEATGASSTHSVATTRFREFLPRPLTDVPANIQRVESMTDAAGRQSPASRTTSSTRRDPRHLKSCTLSQPSAGSDRMHGPHRTHVRHGNAVRVWLRRPWFRPAMVSNSGVVLEPACASRMDGNESLPQTLSAHRRDGERCRTGSRWLSELGCYEASAGTRPQPRPAEHGSPQTSSGSPR